MFRTSWVLSVLCLAVPWVSVAEEKNTASHPPSSIDVHPNCDAVSSNLVANCGFETGAFPPWVQSGDLSFTSVTPVAAHSGNFGAAFGPPTLGFIAQMLPTVPGQTYTISFWLRNVGQPSEFQLYWDGILISDWISVGTFVFVQLSFPGQMASLSMTEIRFGFSNVPDFFFIDDIVVEQDL